MSSPRPTDLRPIHADPGAASYLRQMWERRHLAVAIPMEELRVSHQNTFLGNVWHLAGPLLTVATYYLIFGVILNTSRGVENYLVWMMIGVFTYHLTRDTVGAGAKAISGNQGLMRSIRFPRALLPVSVVVERLLTFGFEMAILTVVVLISGEGISTRWLALPVVLTLHSCLNLGATFVAARINDAFQDAQQIIPFLFRLGTYASGVMFPIERILESEGAPNWVVTLVAANPLVTILGLYRWAYLGTPVDLAQVALTVAVSAALLVFGFRYFRAAEARYGRA